MRIYPGVFDEWLANPENVEHDEIENFDDFQRRTLNAVLRIQANHSEDDNVILVLHRWSIKALLGAMLGTPKPYTHRFKLNTGGYTVVKLLRERGITLFMDRIAGPPIDR